MNPNAIVAYLVLFSATGFLFLFAALLFGRFIRPYAGNSEKLQTYECGEPSVGSSYVQFDLRFYVVALVFIIFEVEVAFFFPWATVFGKAMQITTLTEEVQQEIASGNLQPSDAARLGNAIESKFRELGATGEILPEPGPDSLVMNRPRQIQGLFRGLALAAMIDMAAFFAILLLGFAYVWNRGDLDWVRAVGRRGVGGEADESPGGAVAGAVGRGTSS